MVTTTATGLTAVFFTLVFFTAVGFMVRVPLEKQGGKAVIQYLVLGMVLVLAQNVPWDDASLGGGFSFGWWPAVAGVLSVGALAAAAAGAGDGLRRKAATRTGITVLLVLFCMGISYIAAASVTMLTGVRIPWAAASFLMAALVRNTTGMDEEEFPDAQCETVRQVSLCAAILSVVMPG